MECTFPASDLDTACTECVFPVSYLDGKNRGLELAFPASSSVPETEAAWNVRFRHPSSMPLWHDQASVSGIEKCRKPRLGLCVSGFLFPYRKPRLFAFPFSSSMPETEAVCISFLSLFFVCLFVCCCCRCLFAFFLLTGNRGCALSVFFLDAENRGNVHFRIPSSMPKPEAWIVSQFFSWQGWLRIFCGVVTTCADCSC